MAPFDPYRQAWPNGPDHVQMQMLAQGPAGPSPLRLGPTTLDEALQASRARWIAECRERLTAAADDTARLVMAVAAATYISRNGDIWPQQFATDWEAVYELCSGLDREPQGTPPTEHAPWAHDAIHAWFMRQDLSPPRELVVQAPGWLWDRRRRVLCWWFAAGSTHRSTGNTPQHASAGILTDGSRVYGFEERRATLRPLRPGEGFNAAALTQMAALARLPRLPGRPHKPSR